MGLTLNEVLGGIVDGGSVPLAIATNDDTLLVTYAFGNLVFTEAVALLKGGARPATLASENRAPLKLFSSNRMRMIDPVVAPFAPSPRQPFDADRTEKLSVSVSLFNSAGPTFTLTRAGQRFSVPTILHNRVYVGDGRPFGSATGSVYLFSLGNVAPPPKPPG